MYPTAYIQFLIHFHTDRDYFECHEILEEYWKEESVDNRKKYLVGLIQIAVSMYHYRRGNFIGAEKMMKNALKIIKQKKAILLTLGILTDELIPQLNIQLSQIKKHSPYQDINLPLNDDLQEICQTYCHRNNLIWKQASNLSNNFLINKHTLRDRSKIIRLRKLKLNNKS